MGVFADIVELVKSSDVLKDFERNAMTKKYTSIASRASEGTMQFPIIVSDSMDIDTLQMIVKALERNYATFLQTAITMNATADVSKVGSATDYLKQFHQNQSKATTTNGTYMNVVKVLDNYTIEKTGDKYILSEVYDGCTRRCAEINREQLVNLLEDLRYDILNNKFTPRNETIYNFKDKNLNAYYNGVGLKPMFEQSLVTEAPVDIRPDYDAIGRASGEIGRNALSNGASEHDVTLGLQIRRDGRDTASTIYAGRKDAREDKRHPYDMEKIKTDIRSTNNQMYTYTLPPSVLKDNDVKKANELIATTLHVRINWVNSQGVPQKDQDFILGVKGTMHPVKSSEMVSNVVGACKNNDKVFNFFRWTTGEISFFRDFWLGIKDIKADVANEARGASRWWIALKNRRTMGKISDTVFIKNKILPNATLVLSAEEAEYIKVQYGYDIMNPYFLKKIMDTYYLLGVVVVDSSSQIAHFFFDSDTDFQSVSFSGLEKENGRDERKFKEMLKVINRN